MQEGDFFLMISAVSLGFFHVLIGPDHYVPFIVISRARNWSVLKTSLVTMISGLLHIGSSVLIGIAGIRLGVSAEKLSGFESLRGEWAVWALLAFGVVCLIYGLRKACERQLKIRAVDFSFPRQPHDSEYDQLSNYFPWALFIIFVLGPCEPLIPMIMVPSLRQDVVTIMLLVAIFGFTTIITMLGMVLAGAYGLRRISLRVPERWSFVSVGIMIILCAGAVKFWGL
jgi:sulfite exporter TauE/SafE